LVLVVDPEEASSGIIYLLLYDIWLKLFVSELRSTTEIGVNNQYENEKVTSEVQI
jgi:hypothetical protein